MDLLRRAAALCLSAALLLPSALAADTLTPDARREDLETLYTTLVERHPDLFANTPESAFLEKKAEIEGRIETSTDLEFTFDLQSLTALAGDSHTAVQLGSELSADMHFFPISAQWFEGRWVLSTAPEDQSAHLGRELVALNGHSMADVLDRFSTFVSADNAVKLRRQTRQLFYAQEILVYLGLAEPGAELTLTLSDGAGGQTTFSCKALSSAEMEDFAFAYLSAQREQVPATASAKRYYFSLALDEETYYIQYNRCREDPELPMEAFAAQVAADLASGTYKQVLLDLRNNGGGSDGVIQPLLAVLAPRVWDGSLRLWGLIGETTFSSAIINAVMLQEMGGLLAGTPTSGSVDHFGSVGGFPLPNSGLEVGCSSKMIALSGLLESAQGCGVDSLRPDLTVEPTLDDYLAGRDTEVDYLLAHGTAYQVPDQSGRTLTRGHFLTQLYRAAGAAGKDLSAPENRFSDVLPFCSYTPAVDWAAQNGLALGNGEDAFEPARALTAAEAAVLLVRFADYMGLSLPQGGAAPADAPAWAAEALARCSGLGLEEPGGSTFTRAQGEAWVAALTA